MSESFKTTEFVAFLAVVAGILIAAAITKSTNGHHDVLMASKAWLYVTIVTVGYMVYLGGPIVLLDRFLLIKYSARQAAAGGDLVLTPAAHHRA